MLFARFIPVMGVIFSLLVSGCGFVGSNNILGTDPTSGGVDAPVSALADISLPRGLQRYPEHGFVNIGGNGTKEGLEILRGHVDSNAAAMNFFNTLKSNGWQLLVAQRKNIRAVYLYSRDQDYLIISCRPQGALTLVEIWRSSRLPEGAELPGGFFAPDSQISIAPEEYGPLQNGQGDETGITEEKWGGSLEEKEL